MTNDLAPRLPPPLVVSLEEGRRRRVENVLEMGGSGGMVRVVDLVVSTCPEFLVLFKKHNMSGRCVHVDGEKVNATVAESLETTCVFHVDGKYQVLTFAHVKYTT